MVLNIQDMMFLPIPDRRITKAMNEKYGIILTIIQNHSFQNLPQTWPFIFLSFLPLQLCLRLIIYRQKRNREYCNRLRFV